MKQYRNSRYFVSQEGHIFAKWGSRFKQLKPGYCTGGYYKVNLYMGGAPVSAKIHCMVAEVYYGPRPPGAEINHKNTIKTDNHPDNLEYTTSSGNKQHAIAHGLDIGNKHGKRLTPSQVLYIRSSPLGYVSLSRELGFTRWTIRNVKRGVSYKSLLSIP